MCSSFLSAVFAAGAMACCPVGVMALPQSMRHRHSSRAHPRGSGSRAHPASVAAVVEGCPLPADADSAHWCHLTTKAGQAKIAATAIQRDEVSRSVCLEHKWEHASPQELGLPAHLTRPDGRPPIMLDVGGNLGATTLLFAKSGYQVTVVEAMTQNQRLMNATMCANPDIRHLVKVEGAIVSTPSKAGIFCKVCIDHGSDATVLCPGDGRGPECNSQEPLKQKIAKEFVQVKTLDQIAQEHKLSSIDLMKMDIEGYECQALEGAHKLLNEIRPRYIVSEIQNNPPKGALVGCTPEEMVNIFRKANYVAFSDSFNGTPLMGAPQIEDFGYPQVYFVREDMVDRPKLAAANKPGRASS